MGRPLPSSIEHQPQSTKLHSVPTPWEDPRTHPQPESVARNTTQRRCSKVSFLPQKSRQDVCVPWPPCMCMSSPDTLAPDCPHQPRGECPASYFHFIINQDGALYGNCSPKTNIPSLLHPAYLYRDSRLRQPASGFGKMNN